MVPGFEAMGITVLLNESVAIERGEHRVWLVGLDDAHYYEVDDIAQAMKGVDSAQTVVPHPLLFNFTCAAILMVARSAFRAGCRSLVTPVVRETSYPGVGAMVECRVTLTGEPAPRDWQCASTVRRISVFTD
jgi:hypothetical protein